ncbi:alpha-amylase family glycosyl hydrolase [Curtobacterium sp. MCJR17_043]|uniref:alpha-amylase family glycosyl hydrolase n=1 Tax=Curtobacterium sp. MCJR17_043 TaxID=2175660 RepID=UPI0024DF4DC6|nr:alpha-amylase family glycosyl hydrolase [Curtobacterium sp. MCJR17_043]WIB35499.1 alpha-amylase family glycosyl hydrolase [Curtobacterium sp. MCJR17_043]
MAAARERGIRVLLDGVFNHVGREHPAFRQLETAGPDADTAGLFAVDWSGWQPGQPVPVGSFEGHDILVALDHASQQTEDLVVAVMTHWLERGIDGWRLDAAYAVPPAFWARVLPRVRERFPDAWFSGEVIHGDTAAIVRESTMDSTTQYELWQGIWHGIADRNCFELAHAIERHDELLATSAPSTFVGNHDVTRIASAVGGGVRRSRRRGAPHRRRHAVGVRGRRVRLDRRQGAARGRRRRRPPRLPGDSAGTERDRCRAGARAPGARRPPASAPVAAPRAHGRGAPDERDAGPPDRDRPGGRGHRPEPLA